MKYQLRISGKHYKKLVNHLYPGDGKEAVAVALCGRHENGDLSILMTHELELIPHDECVREENFIHWKTERIVDLLEKAAKHNMAILKIHCHPGGYREFSELDDKADQELFTSVFGWCETESVHGSAIMLPDGEIFGRVFTNDLQEHRITKVSVAGDNILIWDTEQTLSKESFSLRTIQAFGEGTIAKLQNMKVVIAGCSGLGSPTIEQLVRMGVGEVILIDPDIVEEKNLNRILNTTYQDAMEGKLKVDALKDAIIKMGLGTKVKAYAKNLYDSKDLLLDIISADVIFGGLDGVDGRHLLNQTSNFYHIPYFDIGVGLFADGKGGISSIVGSVHYIQPGMSTLLSRGLYDSERLRAECLKRENPQEYETRVKEKYIQGVRVDRPAVISVNMLMSSIAVIEFLNRLHLFKDDSPSYYAKVMVDYCGGCIENTREKDFEVDENAEKWAGRGDCVPFLRMPGLCF